MSWWRDSRRKELLSEMDPDTMIGDTGRKAAELLQEERPSLRELAGRANEIMALETAPDSVRAAYTDRFVLDGEAAALRWFLAWKDARQEGP